jgi:hypothetical protein
MATIIKYCLECLLNFLLYKKKKGRICLKE